MSDKFGILPEGIILPILSGFPPLRTSSIHVVRQHSVKQLYKFDVEAIYWSRSSELRFDAANSLVEVRCRGMIIFHADEHSLLKLDK